MSCSQPRSRCRGVGWSTQNHRDSCHLKPFALAPQVRDMAMEVLECLCIYLWPEGLDSVLLDHIVLEH